MTDQNEFGSARLRNILNLSPGGQRIHLWRGEDRAADTAALADTIAAAVPDLANRHGRIVQLVEGELHPINLAALHGLIDRHVCTVKFVNRGSGWAKEYVAYKFLPAARFDPSRAGPPLPQVAATEPDDKVLDEIFRVELIKRLPRIE
jgi:hypothetical protein